MLGKEWKRVWGCGGGKGSCGERCRKVYWGMGEVRGDGGCGEVLGEL